MAQNFFQKKSNFAWLIQSHPHPTIKSMPRHIHVQIPEVSVMVFFQPDIMYKLYGLCEERGKK